MIKLYNEKKKKKFSDSYNRSMSNKMKQTASTYIIQLKTFVKTFNANDKRWNFREDVRN